MKLLIAVFAVCVMSMAVHAAERIKLPEPQKTGGPDLLSAIDRRASAGQADFPKGELTRQDLSTLLWAASGYNRGGSKWTVPMGMGRPPYTKIYLTDKNGVYLYDWKNHELLEVSREDVHDRIPIQAFAKSAPAAMYMVIDGVALPDDDEWGVLLAGNMSQNVYLASQAVDVGVRLIYSIDRDLVKKAFKLEGKDRPLFSIVMGKR